MPRTFIAIDLDDTIRRRLADLQDRLKPRCGKLKWGDPSKIHLTLKFLGDISDVQIDPIGRALKHLARQSEPFDITIDQLGTFPPTGPVKVLWLGVQDPSGRLAECHGACEQRLEPLGLPREHRRFSPHLTLARNKFPDSSRSIRAALDGEPPWRAATQTVSGILFYQSTLTPKGPIYSVLSRHPFAD